MPICLYLTVLMVDCRLRVSKKDRVVLFSRLMLEHKLCVFEQKMSDNSRTLCPEDGMGCVSTLELTQLCHSMTSKQHDEKSP